MKNDWYEMGLMLAMVLVIVSVATYLLALAGEPRSVWVLQCLGLM